MINNKYFLQKAESLKPILNTTNTVLDVGKQLKKNEEVVLDLKNHFVGYLTLDLSSRGNHQDAPATIEIFIAESIKELNENPDEYNGWISTSWIQKEIIHIDELPIKLELGRRYAGRYIRIKNIDTSYNYDLFIEKISFKSVSSAKEISRTVNFENPLDDKIYDVGLRTLHNCMQTVLEDGPKRDRRLWLGDLRLGALSNYVSYKNNDLVKRCLYMFAGSINDNGEMSSNIFEYPKIEGDNQSNHDYSALFAVTLNEYFKNTNDKETALELIDSASSQVELLYINKSSFCKDNRHTFIDWDLSLNKECCYYGVLSFAIENLIELENALGRDSEKYQKYLDEIRLFSENNFFDKNRKLFISNKQISYASQIWGIMGGFVDKEIGKEILLSLENKNDYLKIISPYLFHYYLEALIKVGLIDLAHQKMRDYYGGMIKESADTFFEIYNPANSNESPYGGFVVNSFCHIWSCTPIYFIERIFKND